MGVLAGFADDGGAVDVVGREVACGGALIGDGSVDAVVVAATEMVVVTSGSSDRLGAPSMPTPRSTLASSSGAPRPGMDVGLITTKA